MTFQKRSNMMTDTNESVMSNCVEKSSAADCKELQVQKSPVKESVVFKAPMPTVFPQNDFTKAVHNKENATARDHDRILDQGLEDSGYLSLQNSHIEDEDYQILGQQTLLSTTKTQQKNATPKQSPKKSQDSLSPFVKGVFTPFAMHRKRNDSYSMSSTPAERYQDTCLTIQNFKQAVCKELAKGFQKNKRYDWSIIPKLAEDFNLDRVIGGQMGVEYVDVFSSLLSRNMKCILARILTLLDDLDLISCKKVSRTWRQIIHEDSTALKRCRHAEKTLRESKQPLGTPCNLTRDAALSRVVMSSVQRVASSKPSPALPQSCRKKGTSASFKTPSRFNQYLEAASALKQHESQRKCTRCGSPATHLKEAQRATCTHLSCQFEFCTLCHESFHGSTPCRQLRPRSHFNSSQTPTILPGSARSKRNVRRL